MPIVSVSLPSELIDSMAVIQESQGYAGRSDVVRAAIRLLLSDTREKGSFAGRVTAILVVTHDESNEEPITRLKHTYDDIVRTHIHNKLGQNNCFELFLLEGEGKKIASMTSAFQKERKLRSVKLLVI
ncbi:CopG family ribbon-helix-helix protein [Candidatus Bathyarchaeota archaeon]|nr:MAG: CopG family ribbon-helix-helix protein [Candidatus Bathyarchaeota archaeon]